MLEGIRQKLRADGHLNELLTGSAITFFLKMFGMALAYLSVFLISKKSGAAGVGMYSIISQVLLVLAMLGTWGTNTSVLRFVGQYSQDKPGVLRDLRVKLFAIILPFSLTFGALTYFGATWMASSLFRNPDYAPALEIAGILLPVFAINAVDTEFIRGLKILKVSEFIRSVLRPLLLVLALLLLWKQDISVLDIIYLFAAIVLVSTLFSTSFLQWRLHQLPTNCDTSPKIRELLKTSGPMMISGLTGTLMSALPLFWIEFDTSTADAGIYGVAMRLAAFISLILMVVNTIAAPKFSSLFWNNERIALQRLLHQSARLMFWCSLGLSLLMLAFATPLLEMFGSEFGEGKTAFILLIIGQFVNTATGSVGLLLNMSGEQSFLRSSALFTLLLQVILLYSLIPTYGLVGAALGFTVSSAIWNIICILYAYRKLKLRTFYFPFIR